MMLAPAATAANATTGFIVSMDIGTSADLLSLKLP